MPPYAVGDVAARLELDGELLRVYSTTIERVGDGFVVDAEGNRHEFDRADESPTLTPVDAELEHELRVKGDGFAIAEELIEHEIDPWEQEPEIGGDGIGD